MAEWESCCKLCLSANTQSLKSLFWLCSNLEQLLQRWMWVRGVISQQKQRLVLLFVCPYPLGGGHVLDDSGRVRKGSRVWGLALLYRWGVSEVCCSCLTLPSPWVRCLCCDRVDSLCNSEDCYRGGMQKLFWLLLKDCVKCSVLLCCVCISLELSYKNCWVIISLRCL